MPLGSATSKPWTPKLSGRLRWRLPCFSGDQVLVETPYKYPDGRPIEVVVVPEWGQYVVTDRRQTGRNFTERNGKDWLGDQEKFDGDDCTRRLSVDFTRKGEVRGLPTEAGDITATVTEVASASKAISSLWASREESS